MAALANHIMGGMGPAAAPPIYQGYQAQIMNPQQLHLMNVQSAQAQRGGQNAMGNAQLVQEARNAAQREEAKKTVTDILMNLSG